MQIANQGYIPRFLGYSFIELLIAMFLSTLLLGLLLQQYLLIKRYHKHTQSKLEQLMEVQWTVDLLRNSIRMAGFTPCANIEQLICQDRLPALRIVQQSLQVSRMGPEIGQVWEQLNDSDLVIDNIKLKPNQLILIADCIHAEVHRIYRIKSLYHRKIITLTAPLHFHYSLPYVGEWIEERYFIKKDNILYYHNRRTEQLTEVITGLSAHQHNQLVQISLTLQDGGTLSFVAGVRAL